MNVALPAIIVFFLLLPGFIFRSGLKRAERQSLDYSPFGQVVAEGVLWSCALHAAWLAAAYYGADLRLDTRVIMDLLSASPTAQSEGIKMVAERDVRIGTYFVSLLVFSFAVPPASRLVVVRFRLDSRDSPVRSIFRLDGAPWYYVLTGADFPKNEVPDLIYATAIVDAAGTPMLYRGVVDDFHVSQDGELDRLILQNTTRRPLASDKPSPRTPTLWESLKSGLGWAQEAPLPERFYPIDGDLFVLRYAETVTLNIQYLRLPREQ
jgi:hypothetical protein